MSTDLEETLVQTILALSMEKPNQKVTVDNILHKAGVCRQSFYNYFRDKGDLVNYAFYSVTFGVLDDACLSSGFELLLNDVWQKIILHRELYKYANRVTGYQPLTEYLHHRLTDCFTRKYQLQFGDAALSDEVRCAIEFHVAGLVNAVTRRYNNPYVTEQGKQVFYACDCLVRGLAPLFAGEQVEDERELAV